jgi:hypothetical protein
MNARLICLAAALPVLLLSPAARSEYRCDPPRNYIDRRACQAALQGPDYLRHFIQRIRVIESLVFDDYVNEATEVAWREQARRERLARAALAPQAGKATR